MKMLMTIVLVLGQLAGTATATFAQQDPALSPTEEQQQKEKAEKERKAFALLENLVDEVGMLRLPENRARIQINAAELLWQRDEGRARSLFSTAAESVAEMLRAANTNPGSDERRGPNQSRSAIQLRQEVVLTAARYDAQLAYQLLATTKPPTPSSDRNSVAEFEDNLEQRLLSEIAALDPKLALRNAELMLDKGQYSRSLAEVLARLQVKDKEAAAKLEDKMIKRLQSANMLSNMDASSLALSLLRSGPRTVESSTSSSTATTNYSGQVLSQTSYVTLLGTVIDSGLKATPQPSGNQRNQGRVRGPNTGGPGGGGSARAVNEPTPAETEQNNARRLLAGLQMLLPQIDQQLPSRSQLVRQKMAELGMSESSRGGFQEMVGNGRTTSDSLMAVATSVPAQAQPRIYQQAAMRALDEGNPERARQIANEHLEPAARDAVLKVVEFRQASKKVDGTRMDQVRQMLAGLRSDDERIGMLVRLSSDAEVNNNPTLAIQLLDETSQYTSRRATNYQHFDQQLRVADAYRNLRPERSFELLEPVVLHLNELLSAAATLNGFEVNLFKDGELPLEGRGGLGGMVSRYGQVLGRLAAADFDRSQTLANRFNLTEPRIIARLAIVRSILGFRTAPRSPNLNLRGPRPETIIRVPQ